MLTPRLEMILRHVQGSSVADIGTDHAYIPIALAQKGLRVIATDISPGPLAAADNNIKKHKLDIELRLGSGLEPIMPNEADTIIIAGMGGEMIEKILAADMAKAKNSTLLLQPMNSQYELRKFLYKNDFFIKTEDLAVEGHKIYDLFVISGSQKNTYSSEIDFHIPPALRSHPLFDAFLDKKERELNKIFQGLSRAEHRDASEIEKYASLLSALAEIRNTEHIKQSPQPGAPADIKQH